MITITGADKVVKVEVNAKIVNTNNLSPMTFVEAHNVVSIEAEHMSKSVAKNGNEWTVLKNYGRTLSSVKVLPVGVSFEKIEEYKAQGKSTDSLWLVPDYYRDIKEYFMNNN